MALCCKWRGERFSSAWSTLLLNLRYRWDSVQNIELHLTDLVLIFTATTHQYYSLLQYKFYTFISAGKDFMTMCGFKVISCYPLAQKALRNFLWCNFRSVSLLRYKPADSLCQLLCQLNKKQFFQRQSL